MFNVDQKDAVLNSLPLPQLGNMMAKGSPMVPPYMVAGAIQNKIQQQAADTAPTPANVNPMGAQPIGQPPAAPVAGNTPLPQAPGVTGLPANNLTGMAGGGVVGHEMTPEVRKEVIRILQGELDRRAKLAKTEGVAKVKHFYRGGPGSQQEGSSDLKDLMSLIIFGSNGQQPEDATPELSDIIPTAPSSFVGDGDPAALAEFNRRTAARLQRPALNMLPQINMKGASVPSIVNGDLPGAAGSGIVAALPSVTPDDMGGGINLPSSAVVAAATPINRMQNIRDTYNLMSELAGPSNATKYQDQLAEMKTNQSSPVQQGFLSGIGRLVQGGYDPHGNPMTLGQNLGAALGTGIQAGQAVDASNEANRIKLTAEQLHAAQLEDTAKRGIAANAIAETGQDVRADRAAQAAQYQADSMALREKMQQAGFTQQQIIEGLKERARQTGQMALFNQQQIALEFKALQGNPSFTLASPEKQQQMIDQLKSVYGGLSNTPTALASAPAITNIRKN